MTVVSIISQLVRGKTLLRALMNESFQSITLNGSVLDIGGGKRPSYYQYFKKNSFFQRVTVDIDPDVSHARNLDLDENNLPYKSEQFDQVLAINFLEHIFSYERIVGESFRVLKHGGMVIGFVPFLMQIHPDPHDYFRYTEETLSRLFIKAGFKEVTIQSIGFGPCSAAFNIALSFLPRILSVTLFPFIYICDVCIVYFRPSFRKKFPLGYTFTAIK